MSKHRIHRTGEGPRAAWLILEELGLGYIPTTPSGPEPRP
jgi:hypothetical protein